MYDHTFYKQVQISRSDIRPHIKWAVSLVILHMITSIFLWALCGYIWVKCIDLEKQTKNPMCHNLTIPYQNDGLANSLFLLRRPGSWCLWLRILRLLCFLCLWFLLVSISICCFPLLRTALFLWLWDLKLTHYKN